MKVSPINEIHKSIGAKFVEVCGWEMPAHYGDPVTEHLNVRKGVGIADITHRGKVRISGKDRTMFLQKILSQDVNKLTPDSGAYSTLLDIKGRMLAYMRIYCDEDSYLIDTEPGLSEKIVQILTHYLFREDVRIEDVTEEYGLVTIQGPLSGELLSNVTGTEIKDMPECSHLELRINGAICKVVRTSYTGEEGYDIYARWGETPAVWEILLSGEGAIRLAGDTSRISLRNTGGVPIPLVPFGIDALETLRIEARTPVYSVDMDEHTIPLEADLDNAISYDKGCYIGQETIARIKFRGHVNRALTGFCLSESIIPQKGDRVYKIIHDIEHDIGIITSGCLSPIFNRPIALGYIRIEHNEPGEVVYIERGEQKVTAVVTKPPFYQRI